ncbi:MAG TPA: hypothetical protein VK550_26200 [Polyangiaceae bacterium]|nr:hypothetical protein [Polyangiaceae bacterium]
MEPGTIVAMRKSTFFKRLVFLVGPALALLALAGSAEATTITVNVSGAPQTGKCSLTDAVQAATTNTAVHSCPAGSSSSTDTIQLAAGTTYQSYGKTLLFPTTGGAVVIQGTSARTTIIRAPDYGYPSPNPLSATEVCPFPSAIFAGGTLTVKNLILQASTGGTKGICQYAGSLTLDNTLVGDTAGVWYFEAGAITSYPNTSNIHRTLLIKNFSDIWGNTSPGNGAGLALFGDVDTTINNSQIEHNESDSSGGGIYWSGIWGKMGNLTLTNNTEVHYNGANAGWGGGIYLGGDDALASVTIDNGNMQVNAAAYLGGAIYMESGVGDGKVMISNGSYIGPNNTAFGDSQQASLNSDSYVYNKVWCQGGATIYGLTGSEWTGHSPPLNDDGTCSFP